MKERTRKGTFRSTETIAYKMAKHNGFDQVSWMAFQEAALDKYDFTTCQRADGSYYGSRGRCIKGSEATKPEKGGGKKKPEGGGGGGGNTQAEAKNEAKGIVEIAGGDAEGMIVKGGERVKPDSLMKNVGKQIEKEYGIKMDSLEANGEKVAPGYIDGFVTTKSGTSMSVSMEYDGESWVVEAMDVL